MPQTLSRPLALLKLPEYEVPRLVTMAQAMVLAMTGNPQFASPQPPLATVQAAIDALHAAETATLTRLVGSVAVRDEKRRALVSLLQQLQSYVQATADANLEQAASIIENAGMSVKKPHVQPPRVFAAKQGRVSGEVKLLAPKAGKYAGYEWAYSTDDKETWVAAPYTVRASTTIAGFTPGTTVFFRYRAVTKAGVGDWSDPVSMIVA